VRQKLNTNRRVLGWKVILAITRKINLSRRDKFPHERLKFNKTRREFG